MKHRPTLRSGWQSLLSLLRDLVSVPPRPARQRRRSYVPAVEDLEGRVLLNSAPVAVDQGLFTVLHGQTVGGINPFAGATDADQDELSVSFEQYPSKGTLGYNDVTERYEFIAYPWETGADSITFRLFDGEDYSNLATIQLSITNTVPVATNQGPLNVLHGQTLTGINPLAGSIDQDGDELTISFVQYPSKGTLAYNDVTETYEYTAYPWETGADSIVFRLHDGAEYSNEATISLFVGNTAPLAANQGPLFVLHGNTLTIDLLAGSFDDDGDELTVSIEQYPTKGTLAYNDVAERYEFTAYSWETGADSIIFQLHDGAEYSNGATISLLIDNTVPVAANQGPLYVLHGETLTGIDFLAGSIDDDGDELTVSIAQYPSKGTLAYNDVTQTYEFTAYAWESGADSIVFQLHDGAAYSNVATISLFIDNNAPVAQDDSATTDEDTPVIIAVVLNDTEPDGDGLFIQSLGQPLYGLVIDNGDGTITYDPNGEFNYLAPSGIATDSFSYTVADIQGATATAQVTVTITGVYDPDPYTEYVQRIGQADQLYESNIVGMAAQSSAYIATLWVDALNAQASAYGTYESAVLSAWDSYLVDEGAADFDYVAGVQYADSVNSSALTDADTLHQTTLDGIIQSYDSDVESAWQDHLSRIAPADALFAQTMAPYLAAWDQAYADFLGNPDDPAYQAALADAQDQYDTAEAVAALVRDAVYQSSQGLFFGAVDVAFQTLQTQATAADSRFNSDVNAALQAWLNAENGAWGNYDTGENDAFDSYETADNQYWSDYSTDFFSFRNSAINLAAAEVQHFATQKANELLAWQASEQLDWNDYVSARGNASEHPLGQRTGEPQFYPIALALTVATPPQGDAAPVRRIHAPADARGVWVEGTRANGVFEYSDTPLNQERGIVGSRVRFSNGYIALGGFPAAWYWQGSADAASVEIDVPVAGTNADFDAADEAMRRKVNNPNWQRPAGYTWNHAGPPGSRVFELVDSDKHGAVHHEGSASTARAARRAQRLAARRTSPSATRTTVARAFAAMTVFTTFVDACEAAGILSPTYVPNDAPYHFVAADGSVFYVQLGGWGFSPRRVYVEGPRKDQEEIITNFDVEVHTRVAEYLWGKLLPGPRFRPGTLRTRLPWFEYDPVLETQREVGYIDETGEHRYPSWRINGT